jgi:glycosyltransferase involved in cell wall biosynthesis
MVKDKDILFVAGDLDFGGAQMHLVELVNHLDSHIHSTIFILSDKDALAARIKPGVEIRRSIRRWRFDTSPVDIIAEQITTKKFASLFAVDLFAFVFLALARKRTREDFAINVIVHNTRYANYTDYFRSVVFSQFRRAQDVFISVCQAQAHYFAKYYFVPRDRFLTIYNGVDTSRFVVRPSSFNAEKFRSSLDIPTGAKVIIQVATLRKMKAHEDSIKALKVLHDYGSDNTCLLIVGGGNDSIESDLRLLAKNNNVEKYVRFCGMQHDVLPFYWISDLFTLSSFAVETFSISALEAMATGLPCVLTDLGGAMEMVTEGENGYVVPVHNPKALAEGWHKALNGNLSLTKDDIRRIIIERFSLDSMVRSFEAIIN